MTGPDLDALQGNILRGYNHHYRSVRHLILRVADPPAARAALAAMTNGDRSSPHITSARPPSDDNHQSWCLNLGITYHGLQALQVPTTSLDTFPPEFRQGMPARAARLGDIGASAPAGWIAGLADTEQVDLIATIHGHRRSDLEPITDQLLASQAGRAFQQVATVPDGQALEVDDTGQVLEADDTDTTPRYRQIHFGYRDGISQPRFQNIHPDHPDGQPFTPIGAILLGHPTAVPHLRWRVPHPDTLGLNGTFNAFRILRQDVKAFAHYLTTTAEDLNTTAKEPGCSPDLVAAKLCGRWPNGAPLTLADTEQAAQTINDTDLNNFGYRDTDPDGTRCPIGAHIRRSNPRDAHIVQRAANRTRTIIRRGMPYGPPYPGKPDDEHTPRGLLGNFTCANLAAQFEALQYDWLNLGLQDPRITGTNDPLVGVNHPTTSHFHWPTPNNQPPTVLHKIPQFVTTQGGAYTYLPTLPALHWIATQHRQH